MPEGGEEQDHVEGNPEGVRPALGHEIERRFRGDVHVVRDEEMAARHDDQQHAGDAEEIPEGALAAGDETCVPAARRRCVEIEAITRFLSTLDTAPADPVRAPHRPPPRRSGSPRGLQRIRVGRFSLDDARQRQVYAEIRWRGRLIRVARATF